MNIEQSAAWAVTKLKPKTKNPHIEAEILLSHVLKKPRECLLAHEEKKLTKTQISNIQYLISKRLEGIPIAYIVGYKYFYGLKFKVNKRVLIPRPETELMVEETLKHVTHNTKYITIIDIGTGSGCIIISIIKQLLKSKLQITNYKFLATDISKPALQIARKNAKFHKVNKKIKFLQGNLLEPILKNKKLDIRNYNLVILTNLPYLTPTQIKKSPSIKHEPKLALTAGPDGLKYYKKLFRQIPQITNYKLPITILCEIDPSQTREIKQLIKKELPPSRIQIKKDLRGLNRLVIIKF